MKASTQTLVYVDQPFYRTYGREETVKRMQNSTVGQQAVLKAVALLHAGKSVMCFGAHAKEIK